VLTPNREHLRESRRKHDVPEARGAHRTEAAAPPVDTRWHFRADPTAPPVNSAPLVWQGAAAQLSPAPHGTPGAPAAHPAIGAPPGQLTAAPFNLPAQPGYGAPHAAQPVPQYPATASAALPATTAAPSAPVPRPRPFNVKKWKVVKGGTVVRTTEQLSSEEVQKLQEGAVVEQVAPAFKLQNGIVRIQIRHPSSPEFPNPIGWVTQDASAAGGPKFLEPGPEPMQKTSTGFKTTGGAAPVAASQQWSTSAAPQAWRPRAPASPGMRPYSPRPGLYGFQNLIWTPGGGSDTA